MTMSDLIRYLPVSNPMTTSLGEEAPENEFVVPPSPGREESPETAQEPKLPLKTTSGPQVGEEEEVEVEVVAEEENADEEALMVPRVKVAEDGSLIIDEESLTVEVQRAKGPNPAQERDPIFERGSTTTYSSFRKGTYTKPWSDEETDMFFLAISMVGTDFSMICQLFPHRARSEIKNKFKKEERANAWRIDKAFRERRRLDIEYFCKLLEKILEFHEIKKKLKKLVKNFPKVPKKKTKGKRSAKTLSDVDEVAVVQPPKPTRYGRVPKPRKPADYPVKVEARSSSASEATPASAAKAKPKRKAKRARPSKSQPADPKSKKPKLITLRATLSDDSDGESQWEVEEVVHPGCSFGKDSTAPAFVPISLRSPRPVISEVEETVEELDIFATMPDVLGISQDALCPDASCELAQNETGTAEPCEHQLDLLLDVIDFLSSDHPQVSDDQSYNEAAQTLLTIGNMAHLSQNQPSEMATHYSIDVMFVSIDEGSQPHLDVEIGSKQENCVTSVTSVAHGEVVTETPKADVLVELEPSTSGSHHVPVTESMEPRLDSYLEPDSIQEPQSSPERSKKHPPPVRRGLSSRVKPKPNLGQASRGARSKPQPEPLVAGAVEVAANPDRSQTSSDQDDVTCTAANLTEQPACQEWSVDNVKSHAAPLDQQDSEEATMGSTTGPGAETSETSCPSVVTSIAPVAELQSEDQTSSATRKSRFPKVKPKPNLAHASRTARLKSQTTKEPVEEQSNLTPRTTAEAEAEPKCTPSSSSSSPKQPGQSTCQASDLIPSLGVDTTLPPTDELSANTETRTDVGALGRVDQSSSVCQAQCEPSREEMTQATRTASECTGQKPAPQAGRAKSGRSDLLTSHRTAQSSRCDPPRSDPMAEIRHSDLPGSAPTAEIDRTDPPTSNPMAQSRHSDPPISNATAKSFHSDLPTCDPKAEISCGEPLRSDATAHSTRSDPPTSDPTAQSCCGDPPGSEPTAKIGRSDPPRSDSTAKSCHGDSLACDPTPESGRSDPPRSEPAASQSQAASGSGELSSSNEVLKRDSKSDSAGLNLPQRRQRLANLKPRLGLPSRTTQANLKSADISQPAETVETPGVEPAPAATSTQSEPEPTANTQQLPVESHSEPQAVQPCLENTVTNQPVCQSADKRESKCADSPKSYSNTPQVRRNRLVKPRPNLARTREAPRKPVQSMNAVDADPHPSSEAVEAPACAQPVAEEGHDLRKPEEGAIEQHRGQSFPPDSLCMTKVIDELSQHSLPQNNAGSSVACATQLPDSDIQHESTSSTGETQIHPSLALFQDVLSRQEPSDPEEMFYILSLTEIPGCDASMSEPVSYLPVTEASVQQQRDSGDGLLSNVTLSVPTEECAETGLSSGIEIQPDPTPCLSSVVKTPLDPNESASVQSALVEESIQIEDEADCPSAPQRQTAKQQVKSKVSRKNQASQAPAVKDEEAALAQHTLTDLDEAQTTRTRRTSTHSKKVRDLPSVPPETDNTTTSPPVGKAKQGPKVRAPNQARQVARSATSRATKRGGPRAEPRGTPAAGPGRSSERFSVSS